MIENHCPRFIEKNLLDRLASSPAVILHGSRQCGKTTIAKKVLEPLGYRYYDLEEKATRDAALADPSGFAFKLPERVILDEVQNVPELFSALRVEIDRRRTNGRFLLTGSSHVLFLPKITRSLAGRLQFLQLHPLSQCEVRSKQSGFLDCLFANEFRLDNQERLGNAINNLIVRGGYPEAQAQPNFTKLKNWHANNLRNVVLRDMEQQFRMGNPKLINEILEMAALRTSGLVNANGMAKKLQASTPTVRRYLGLLEHVFLVYELPSWHRNMIKRQVKAPKLHFGDTGMACALLNADEKVLEIAHSLRGQLVVTFVYQELMRQATWLDHEIEFLHFRHMDRAEVDIVLEGEHRTVCGIKVKAGSTVRPSDFKGLQMLAEAAGDYFVSGVVLYDGEVTIGHRGFFAVPIRQVWEPAD